METARVIQAGMGIGVSNWTLANAVASAGQIGVVSGTGIDLVLVRRLQDGDKKGDVRCALEHFPDAEFAEEILKKYFIPGGKSQETPYATLSMLTAALRYEREKLVILANFVEVFLAKENHNGKIGINFLEKVQLPVLPSLYGALLAGVDYVFMGAGIPREIPAVLDKLSQNQDVEYKLSVKGSGAEDHYRLRFSPRGLMKVPLQPIQRPQFYGIISSTVLALTLTKKTLPPVDGFVIEAPSAGGHNAPPRGSPLFNERGEPVYGKRDEVDFKAIAELGLPFWLAGSMASPDGYRQAADLGAAGIQVGTAFALCDESGLDRKIKDQILNHILNGDLDVFTDPLASPTGFPFKVARLSGTNSEEENYASRIRRCDVGYLREPYKKADGTLGYRCPGEPVDQYIKKGGQESDTVGRKCLCNGLLADIGLPQVNKGETEKPLVTLGDDAKNVIQFMRKGARSFSAQDVISGLIGD
ncbi:MAG: nitronate monooxygenase [Parachlamydiales bacterium]